MKRIVQSLIWFYQSAVSPLLPRTCRYTPTCSLYAAQSIRRHGLIRGFMLTLGRILSCHSLSRRPHQDPVPEVFAWPAIFGYNSPCCPGGDDEHTTMKN